MIMRRMSWGWIAVGFSLSIACGGSKPQPASPAAAKNDTKSDTKDDKDDGVFRPIFQGQLKIAHYATADGTLGLVLDRTGERPKVRVDGEKDIIELTFVEDRHGGERRGWYLKAPDGRNILYLSAGGGLTIFRGRDELRVNSDKAADALPAATIAGEYKAPKSAYTAQLEALKPHALMSQKSSFKPEDSGNLAKVAEAIASAPPDAVYHVTASGAEKARWAPASPHIGDTHQGLGGAVGLGPADDAWDKGKAGIAKFGGQLVPMRVDYDSPNRLRMHLLKGFPAPLAAGTPGIFWELDGSTVVFVAFDGGRYQIDLPNDASAVVESGAGPQSGWPAPLQHALFDVDSVRGLAKGKAVPEQIGKDIEAADDGWWSCMNDQWKKAKTDLDKAEAAPTSANDKRGRMVGIRKSAELAAPKTCEPKKKALDAALTKFIESRNTERLALFDKAKAQYK
jgi:hypothetical protein